MPQDFRHPLRGDCHRRDCPPCSMCHNDRDHRGDRHDDRRDHRHDDHRDHRHDDHRDRYGRNNNWW